MLQVNYLFSCPQEDGKSILYRVLWLSREQSDVIYIEMNTDKGLPIKDDLDVIETALQDGTYRHVIEDQWNKLRRPDCEFSESQIAYRDKAWGVIESIITLPGNQQYLKKERSKMIKKFNLPATSVYRHLRHYWQRGQMKNALASEHNKSGGKGKQKQYTVKLGRPSRLEIQDQRRYGIPLTDDARRKLVEGIKKFYVNRKELSLAQAYQKTIDAYFNQGYRHEEGVDVPIPLPKEKRPTYEQFRRLYYQNFDPKEVMCGRKGHRAFQLRGRRILSDVTLTADYPGFCYEVDATTLDIYLRSRINPKNIVGRPTLYLLVDIFSRMITGYYLGFHHASYKAGSLAVSHALMDKVEHCKRYGVEITQEEWPTVGLPAEIIGDKGEFASYHADTIGDALNIVLKNTPPYRGDMKPIVERRFGLINNELLRLLPGFVKKVERGDRDYRLDAKLNIAQLHKAIIEYILHHNNHRLMTTYPLSDGMIKDGVGSLGIQGVDIRHSVRGVLDHAVCGRTDASGGSTCPTV